MTFDADYMAEIVDRMMAHENYLFDRNDIAEEEELLSDRFQAHMIWLEQAGLIHTSEAWRNPEVYHPPYAESFKIRTPRSVTYHGAIFHAKMAGLKKMMAEAEAQQSHIPNLGFGRPEGYGDVFR